MADAVVADTVAADRVVAGISDAAGKAVPAGVAGQALPEPYVPGSGDKLPAQLRLVLVGDVGVAGGLFAVALACAAAFVLLLLIAVDIDPDGLFVLAVAAFLGGAFAGAWQGTEEGAHAVQARIRFSRLLRQPSDPHTATVTASTRGGRTLILDTTPGGYQPLSEVRLALGTKADMLMPGERVTVYGSPSGKSPLLVSSAQRGRAFLGTETSRSTANPGPLDEKVSGATLVDWAAWAASTTFSYVGVGSSYDTAEVEVFRSAVRDAFLGVGEPPVRSDDVRGKQFSTHWLREGYDKKQVDAFLDAAALRLAAMESTDRPAEPLLVSGATLVAWAEWADSATFTKSRIGHGRGCTPGEVDALREEIRDTFLGATKSPVKFRRRLGQRSSSPEWREIPNGVRGAHFSKPSSDDSRGYDEKQVAAFLDAAGIRLAAMESTDRPSGPLVSEAILARWAAWADSTTFPIRRRRDGYDKADVDAFLDVIRDTFHGIRPPPLTWPATHGNQFTTTRPGYDAEQVDAFLDKAEPRLAAMRATDKGPDEVS